MHWLPSSGALSKLLTLLYPTVEERGAHLLYFLVEDHALKDGAKRGAVALFEEYLRRNERPVPRSQALGRILHKMFADNANKAQVAQMILDVMAESVPA